MAADALVAFESIKTPVQVRATVTVEAISEATIQVLLSQGAERLTTTRVADRAGVSVGTLYQYFTNKRSLLFAVLEDHLEKSDRRGGRCQPEGTTQATRRDDQRSGGGICGREDWHADVSVAMYKIASDVGGLALIKRVTQRMREAIVRMLESAPDVKTSSDEFAVQMMVTAMSGAMCSVLETGGSPAMMRRLREHLVVLCQTYMAATTNQRP
jgi:AcrR family transcriptional regulator